tara:strand:- start:530 stop:811 length:282 start_codon:yes stop_codon:yes gene_type:complete
MNVRSPLFEDLFTIVIDYIDLKNYIKCQQLSRRYLRAIYKSRRIPKDILVFSETLNLARLFDLLGKYKNINRISTQSKNKASIVSVTGNLYSK